MRLVITLREGSGASGDYALEMPDGYLLEMADGFLLGLPDGTDPSTRAIALEFVEPRADGPYPWLTKVGPLLLAARAGHLEGIGVGESANVAVDLNNHRRRASTLLGRPIRARADLYDDNDDLLLAGLIQRIEYAGALRLTLEAASSRLLLTELLPLRTTRALGDYAEDVELPIVLGDLSNAPFPLIRLSATRYFAADHPMQITRVFTERQQTFGWERKLESDEAGHTWTVVEFSASIPQGTDVTACGIGKLNALTGALIENPADAIVETQNIAGGSSDWSGLRAACSGLVAAGRIFVRQMIKAQIDEIAQSFAIMWWHGGARRYPSSEAPSPILDLDVREVDNLRASAASTDTADVLRLAYDWSDASGRALHYIELSASPRRYGGLAKEVVYKWLRTPKDAEEIGVPVLQRLAGDRYDVTFTSSNERIRPGMWVRPIAHPEWMIPGDDPIIMVTQVEINNDDGSVNVTGETIIGQSVVTVTAHSLALPDDVQAGISVEVRDGVATFTVNDEDGKPLAGARVALDGGAPKTTDAQGKVSFPATAGVHELAVEAPGFVAFSIQVTL